MRASLAAGALFAINSKCLNLGGTVSLRKSRTQREVERSAQYSGVIFQTTELVQIGGR